MNYVAAITAACLLTSAGAMTRGQQDPLDPSGSGRLVFDDHRRLVILVDTIDQQNAPTLRTWSWNGERWKRLPGEGPSRRMVGR